MDFKRGDKNRGSIIPLVVAGIYSPCKKKSIGERKWMKI
jgi:hypothetical protein